MIYRVARDGNVAIVSARNPQQARRYAGGHSVRKATDDDIAWSKMMGERLLEATNRSIARDSYRWSRNPKILSRNP